ncbi:MAG: aldolase/citrate lyase family protein [Firmicutes bacterium]|jgi:4-hydroxy-2-oxoheptanedioate aldolase|nr:aldolase/citrate lyase family protein [Bacillota bacterium]
MRPNKVKKALANGEVVIGTMISEVRGPGIITMLATAGFDYVCIDMEHSSYSMETVADMIAASKATDMAAIIRTTGLSRLALSRPLDSGADGLLIPQTETVEEVRQIIEYTKYYPMGQRGMALRRAHSAFAKVTAGEYLGHANAETLIVIQIESETAIRDLDKLVSVPGVDAAFIGPADLSQSYGIPGQSNDPRIQEALARFIEVCNAHGVAPGIHVYNMDEARKWIDSGMRLIAYGNDISMIVDTGMKYTAELKSYIKK